MSGAADLLPKPRYRGATHLWAFVVAVPMGVLLACFSPSAGARAAAIIYAVGVCAMLGTSAAFHRLEWTPARHRLMGRFDHSAIFLAIAGTYTPVALISLDGAPRALVGAIVWGGGLVGIALQWTPFTAPRWLFTLLYVLVGWAAFLVLPQLYASIGALGVGLLLAGGLSYTAGAVVYALRWPDPWPETFGFHEVFHVFVVLGAALQLSAIAFVVLPMG
jgi:hemolysin III